MLRALVEPQGTIAGRCPWLCVRLYKERLRRLLGEANRDILEAAQAGVGAMQEPQ